MDKHVQLQINEIYHFKVVLPHHEISKQPRLKVYQTKEQHMMIKGVLNMFAHFLRI